MLKKFIFVQIFRRLNRTPNSIGLHRNSTEILNRSFEPRQFPVLDSKVKNVSSPQKAEPINEVINISQRNKEVKFNLESESEEEISKMGNFSSSF